MDDDDDAGFEPYDFLPTDPWHEHEKDRHEKDLHGKDLHGKDWHGKDEREARWASLKQGSGGLMADFPAHIPAALRSDEPSAAPADNDGRSAQGAQGTQGAQGAPGATP
ncbi:hypothetical protein GTX14_31330 [Streptomyces sp. SID4944]|nr:hypothetical protein [Streptomyces sp. SID4944]